VISDHILFTLFFIERNCDGLRCIEALSHTAKLAEATLYMDGEQLYRAQEEISSILKGQFNLLEVRLIIDVDNRGLSRELDIRYRPALSSPAWKHLSTLSQEAIDSIETASEERDLNFWLSMSKFRNPALLRGLKADLAVFELLCPVYERIEHPAMTISNYAEKFWWILLQTELWGYADFAPFRDLSVQEEWFIARTDVLWADPLAVEGAVHQYLIATLGGTTLKDLPEGTVTQGQLRIYQY
jgi:hypothetical protein